MITFRPIASSSAGNAYVVESNGFGAPLLIEAGLSIRSLREKIGFNLTGLAGVLCSHEHGDHSKGVKDLLKAGADCFMSHGTAEALGVADHHRTVFMVSGVSRRVGIFTVLPFPLEHDAAEPLGFVISDGEDRLLFVPDTAYVKERFAGLTLIAAEANHCSDILIDKVMDGHLPAVVGRRIRRNHMSLDVLVSMLKANDLSRVRKIHLLHLSDGNSDEKRMVLEVQQSTGIPTIAC